MPVLLELRIRSHPYLLHQAVFDDPVFDIRPNQRYFSVRSKITSLAARFLRRDRAYRINRLPPSLAGAIAVKISFVALLVINIRRHGVATQCQGDGEDYTGR